MSAKKNLFFVVFTAGALSVCGQQIKSWEFNTSGDTEGFVGNNRTTQIDGLTVANAISGTESVLTAADITGIDPQVVASGISIALPAGQSWGTAVIRLRQLTKNPGLPGVASTPWKFGGTTIYINDGGKNPKNSGLIQDSTAHVTIVQEEDGWIVVTFDLAEMGLGNTTITSFRLDPVGNSAGLNFEVDYIRLNAASVEIKG